MKINHISSQLCRLEQRGPVIMPTTRRCHLPGCVRWGWQHPQMGAGNPTNGSWNPTNMGTLRLLTNAHALSDSMLPVLVLSPGECFCNVHTLPSLFGFFTRLNAGDDARRSRGNPWSRRCKEFQDSRWAAVSAAGEVYDESSFSSEFVLLSA